MDKPERTIAEMHALVDDGYHLAIVRKAARNFAKYYPWLKEEFYSDAHLLLVKAARNWDGTKSTFVTYLYKRCHCAMIDTLRNHDLPGYPRHIHHFLEQQPHIDFRSRSINWADQCNVIGIEKPTAPDDDMLTRESLEEHMPGLAAKEKAILRMRYLNNMTMVEIGQVLGISESRISQLHTDIINRLKAHHGLPPLERRTNRPRHVVSRKARTA